MVMNSWNDDGVVNLPWMYPETVPQVREAICLRYRLMPYLYTQMWRASRDGIPAVRPLLYDFPQDAAAIARRALREQHQRPALRQRGPGGAQHRAHRLAAAVAVDRDQAIEALCLTPDGDGEQLFFWGCFFMFTSFPKFCP